MDRETLSSYGWIIITVIVIAAMIGLGIMLKDTIVSSIQGAVEDLQQMASSAMNNMGSTPSVNP